MKMKKKILKTKEEKKAKKKAKLEAKMTFIVMSFLALVEQQISGFSNVEGVMGTYRRFRIWDREQDILHTGNKLALHYSESCAKLTEQFMEARKSYEAHLEAKEQKAAEEKAAAEERRPRLVKRKPVATVDTTEEE
jgi:hypothetical protein